MHSQTATRSSNAEDQGLYSLGHSCVSPPAFDVRASRRCGEARGVLLISTVGSECRGEGVLTDMYGRHGTWAADTSNTAKGRRPAQVSPG